mgnify:CR=1 FL=1
MFKLGGMASIKGLYLETTIRGLIRLASVNHSTGKGGFLKRKKHGNRKKLH